MKSSEPQQLLIRTFRNESSPNMPKIYKGKSPTEETGSEKGNKEKQKCERQKQNDIKEMRDEQTEQ